MHFAMGVTVGGGGLVEGCPFFVNTERATRVFGSVRLR